MRRGDAFTAALLAPLDHAPSRIAVRAERAFLRRLEGGCQVPIAGHATVEGGTVHLTGLVADLEGATVIRQTLSGPANQAPVIGVALAEALLAAGAQTLLETLTANEP